MSSCLQDCEEYVHWFCLALFCQSQNKNDHFLRHNFSGPYILGRRVFNGHDFNSPLLLGYKPLDLLQDN